MYSSSSLSQPPRRARSRPLRGVVPATVCIKPSGIRGAGRGVFATVALPANTKLGWYEGDLLSGRQLLARYGDGTAPYGLCVSARGHPRKTVHIDAAHNP